LFEALVVNELPNEDRSDDGMPLQPVLKVAPKDRAPIVIEWPPEPGQAHCWGAGGDIFVNADEIDLKFIDIWGFHNFPVKDFRYFKCRIMKFPNHPEYEGREVLIEALDSLVFDPE
jgi:hypothetical protein